VLAENFRPGALARLGYGWPVLRQRFPRLVLASTSGFGQTGPDAARPAYDVIVQAMGGLMSVTGPEGGAPVRVGTSIGDITAGLFTAIGVLAALRERDRKGLGTHVDVAMLDGQIAILENAVARFQVTGESPGPLGSRHPTITPFQAFETADRPIVLAAGNDALWRALCAALGRDDLADDPRFRSNADRTAHAGALGSALTAIFETAPAAQWLALLEAAGVPAGPLNDVGAALASPQVAARTMLVETATAGGRPLKVAGNPIKLSGFPDDPRRRAAPALDADRAAILAELGLA
jgi:CoA:oxalate CoA-transferase